MPLPDEVQPLPDPDRFFLPNLTFIDHRDDALPGAIKPCCNSPLIFKGERINPLLPFHPDLLNYVTAEQLGNCTQLELLEHPDEPQIKVTVTLPAPHNRSLSKVYALSDDNSIEGPPVLEIWPNFRSEDWQLYYGFYYDAELENTFQVRFLNAEEEHEHKDSRGGIHQIIRMAQFPSAIECHTRQKETIGLILLRQPQKLQSLVNWMVGVDFNNLFTNLYVQHKKDVTAPFPINYSLHHKVTESNRNTRFLELFEYFIPEEFLPVEQPLPIANVLTKLGRGNSYFTSERPIFDGRILCPTVRFDPNTDYFDTNISFFSNDRSTKKLFLKNLVLLISAIAAAHQVRQIQWSIAYPASATRQQIEDYCLLWQQIIQEFAAQTGIQHLYPSRGQRPPESSSPYICSSALAFAQYIADEADNRLVSTTCIHIQRPTTEIAIWQNNELLHRCTFPFSEVELLYQFLQRKPQLIERLFNIHPREFQGLKKEDFNDRLSVLLHWENEKWLELQRPRFSDDPEFQGLLQLMAIGLAGLHYYIGILLKALRNEAKYKNTLTTPVYIGGGGSFLLHWLDPTGQFNENSEVNRLFNEMLRLGSGFASRSTIPTEISQHPKAEIAWGLVLHKTQLQEPRRSYPLIPGEDCEINGQRYAYNESYIPEAPQSLSISNPKQLQQFLHDFHQILRNLRIENIRPLKHAPTQSLSEEILQTHIPHDTSLGTPPFILGLKALLRYIGREWSKS
jgi:hypothetical protein